MFYVTLLPYSPGFLNFKFSDDSEMTPGQDLGDMRILRSAEALEPAGLAGWWGQGLQDTLDALPFPRLIFIQSSGRTRTLREPGMPTRSWAQLG